MQHIEPENTWDFAQRAQQAPILSTGAMSMAPTAPIQSGQKLGSISVRGGLCRVKWATEHSDKRWFSRTIPRFSARKQYAAATSSAMRNSQRQILSNSGLPCLPPTSSTSSSNHMKPRTLVPPPAYTLCRAAGTNRDPLRADVHTAGRKLPPHMFRVTPQPASDGMPGIAGRQSRRTAFIAAGVVSSGSSTGTVETMVCGYV